VLRFLATWLYLSSVLPVLQVSNIVTFTKWLHPCPTEHLWKQHEAVRNLRAFATSLISDTQDRLPKETTFADLPDYLTVLTRCHRFCRSVEIDATTGNIWDVQCAVVVGLQVYLPPLRGKPFWSLQLHRAPKKSMSLLRSTVLSPFLHKNTESKTLIVTDC